MASKRLHPPRFLPPKRRRCERPSPAPHLAEFILPKTLQELGLDPDADVDLSRRDEVTAMMRDNGFDIPDEFVDLYEGEIEQISADGGFEADGMDGLVEELTNQDLLPPGVEWREHIDLEPLWEAQEANGLERRPDPDSI